MDVKPQPKTLAFRELPDELLPRERLIQHGPASLSVADLVAILLNTGTQGESVTLLAQRIVSESGGLRGLMQRDFHSLKAIKGLGAAKATKLMAAIELGNRVVSLGPDDRAQFARPEDFATLFRAHMVALDHEQLRVAVLDTKNRLIRVVTVYQGSVNSAQVRIGEVFKEAVRANAAAIALAHNHPSGDPTPSAADIALTAEIVQAGDLLDIKVLDHLIIGAERWESLRRLGLGFQSA